LAPPGIPARQKWPKPPSGKADKRPALRGNGLEFINKFRRKKALPPALDRKEGSAQAL
jgi:hypothetical protein